MKFPSEYELINKVSPIEGATVKPCETKEIMLETLEDDINLNYDERPIIIIIEQNNKDVINEILERRKWNKVRSGVSTEVLREIRGWEYGVLILDTEDGLGVNTRFAKDSIVFIVCPIENKA